METEAIYDEDNYRDQDNKRKKEFEKRKKEIETKYQPQLEKMRDYNKSLEKEKELLEDRIKRSTALILDVVESMTNEIWGIKN